MSRERRHQNTEELKWKCLVVGQESPRQFQRAFETLKGWISSSSSKFPMDIILAFPRKMNIWKFVIGCSDSFLRELKKWVLERIEVIFQIYVQRFRRFNSINNSRESKVLA